MKFTTIYLEENKIEIFNSILGRETIKVNGEIVSSKFSITGAEHIFSITENGTITDCKLKLGFGFNGVVFDLYKNNKPIVESPKSGCLILFIVVFFIALVIGLLKDFVLKWNTKKHIYSHYDRKYEIIEIRIRTNNRDCLAIWLRESLLFNNRLKKNNENQTPST